MGSWTIRNLAEDVEDQAPKFGHDEHLEARFARTALEAERLGVSLQRLKPDKRAPFAHKHEAGFEELYVVVRGSGRVSLDGEVRELRPLDAIRVAGEVVRFFEAGPDGLDVLAFGEAGMGGAEMLPSQ
jgi:quercetin dioxygenase-like cupin family protein